jgi:hypothetical protein
VPLTEAGVLLYEKSAIRFEWELLNFADDDRMGIFYPAFEHFKLHNLRDNGNKRGIDAAARGWHQLYQQ